MKTKLALVSIAIVLVAAIVYVTANASAQSRAKTPQFTKDGKLLRPDDYREWVYLSSGFGMSYKAGASADPGFTNVFVLPEAYRAFTSSGKWPNGAMFVVEERQSSNKGSINKAGHFQTDFAGMGVEVKDASRFPQTWAYFSFSAGQTRAEAFPQPMCWECHNQHGAVENTFVQFYPTLQPVARRFGVYKER